MKKGISDSDWRDLTDKRSREVDAIKFVTEYGELCRKYRMCIQSDDIYCGNKLYDFDPQTDTLVYDCKENYGPDRWTKEEYDKYGSKKVAEC